MIFLLYGTIMKTFGWLLLLITVCFAVSAHSRDILFQPMALERDLDDIIYYRDAKPTFFLHWPESITFIISKLKPDSSQTEYLRIYGGFQIRDGPNTLCYDSLYYTFSHFHVKESNGGKFLHVQHDEEVFYVQPFTITETKPYVSIKYYGLNDRESNRLVASNSYKKEGSIRLLVGKGNRNEVKVSENVEHSRERFLGAFGISIDKVFKKYFGFCDTGPGYMIEVQESGVTTLSRNDLYK